MARLADRDTYLAQQPDNEWEPPPPPSAEETEAARRERIRHLQELEEAGLVTITRHESGAWTVVPRSDVVIERTDNGER